MTEFKSKLTKDFKSPDFEGMKIVFIQKMIEFLQDIAKYEKCSKALNEYKKKKENEVLDIDKIDFEDETLKDIEELKDFKKTLDSYRNFEEVFGVFNNSNIKTNQINSINEELYIEDPNSPRNQKEIKIDKGLNEEYIKLLNFIKTFITNEQNKEISSKIQLPKTVLDKLNSENFDNSELTEALQKDIVNIFNEIFSNIDKKTDFGSFIKQIDILKKLEYFKSDKYKELNGISLLNKIQEDENLQNITNEINDFNTFFSCIKDKSSTELINNIFAITNKSKQTLTKQQIINFFDLCKGNSEIKKVFFGENFTDKDNIEEQDVNEEIIRLFKQNILSFKNKLGFGDATLNIGKIKSRLAEISELTNIIQDETKLNLLKQFENLDIRRTGVLKEKKRN